MSEEFDIAAEVNRAARKARTSNDLMELEDLVQELWVFYLDTPSMHGYDHSAQQRLLVKQARKVLQQERIDYMHFSGAFVYTPDGVRTILTNSVWAEVDDVGYDVEGRADVQAAMRDLSVDARKLLYRQFVLGEQGKFTEAQGRAARRAVDKITARLNTGARVERADPENVNTAGGVAEAASGGDAW